MIQNPSSDLKKYRFEFNPSFNQPIGLWETKSLQIFERMFFNASKFDQSLCWDIEPVPSPSFQVFCNSSGRFNTFCVNRRIDYDANRRCVSALDDWVQSWTDIVDCIVDKWNDFIDFINKIIDTVNGIFECFAPDAMTFVENRGMVAMKDLQVGDKVLTGSGRYQPIYSMFHFDRTKPTPYLQIHTVHSRNVTGVQPLEMTANHMLYVVGYENPIPAWQLKLGDFVYIMKPTYSSNGETKHPWKPAPSVPRHLLQQSQVVEIRHVVRHGLFNPLTEDATIVVDGIVTSAYTSFLGTEHIRLFRNASSKLFTNSARNWLEGIDDGWTVMSHQSFVHILLSPYRAICLHVYPEGYCKTPEGSNDNSVWYGRLGQFILLLWLQQHVMIQAIIFVLLVTVFGMLDLILNSMRLTVLVILLGSLVPYRRKSSLSKQ